jgi:Mat/Ecp fimbriae outer membrane usher protein
LALAEFYTGASFNPLGKTSTTLIRLVFLLSIPIFFWWIHNTLYSDLLNKGHPLDHPDQASQEYTSVFDQEQKEKHSADFQHDIRRYTAESDALLDASISRMIGDQPIDSWVEISISPLVGDQPIDSYNDSFIFRLADGVSRSQVLGDEPLQEEAEKNDANILVSGSILADRRRAPFQRSDYVAETSEPLVEKPVKIAAEGSTSELTETGYSEDRLWEDKKVKDMDTLEAAVEQPPTDFNPAPELLDTTLFDLYLGETLKGRALVHFMDDYCRIDNPADVLDQLTQVKSKEGLDLLLAGWMKKKKIMGEVGSLECDTATFRIIVKLGQDFLKPKQLNLLDKVPDPKNEFSLQQRLRGAASGDIDQTLTSSVQNRTIVSKGRNWAVLDGTYVNDVGYEIDEASVSRTIDSIETTVGLLRTEGQFFASSVDYAGITLRTSPNVFLNRDTLRGTPIEVFVPSRSRVEFFRGKRLLAVDDLDYGLQEIDTSNFPQGSYDVDIVITEDNGRVIREKRLFTKSGLLEAGPIPIFSLELGNLRDRRSVSSIPVGQLGLTWRLLDFLQLNGSAYGTEDLQLGATEFTALYKGVILQGGYIHSNNNDAAYMATVAGNINFLNWNFTIREAIKGFSSQEVFSSTPNESEILDPFDEIRDPVNSDDFNVLPNTISNINGSVGVQHGDFRLRYSYNSNEAVSRGVTQKRYSYGPRFDWTFYRRVKTQLNFQTSMLDTEEGRKFIGFVSFNYRFGKYSFEENVQHRDEARLNESRVLTSLNYDSKTFSGRGTRARLTDELITREVKESAEGRVHEVRNRLEVDHTNDVSQLRGFARDLQSSENDSTSIGLDLNTNFTVDKDASIRVSSPPLQDSMVLVHVKGSSAVGDIDIIINGQVRDTIKAGGTAAVGLTPFQVYRLNIRPAENAKLLDYDSDVREFSLFPGNMVKETWTVEPIYIGIGRLVDEAGNPLPWTRIKGPKHYTITEEDGVFQAELSAGIRLSVEKNELKCELRLPKAEKMMHVHDFGDLPCRLK